MSELAFAWRLLRRDWRTGELRLLAVSLLVAVTAVTAVLFFTDRVQRAMELQAAELLAADLVVLMVGMEAREDSDVVARTGGEEFLLCFPETDSKHAAKVCNELRRDIENADWSDIAEGFGVTISFGVTECKPGSRRRTVINDADMRLYRAKREGRNRVVLD